MDPWQPLFDKLTQLKESWPKPEWSWDSRFGMVASSFASELEAAARASTQVLLPQEWTSTTIATAPDETRGLARRTGGLRSGQLLLAGCAGAAALYGLWWPWGRGENITLRLGLAGIDVSADPVPRLRALFETTTG